MSSLASIRWYSVSASSRRLTPLPNAIAFALMRSFQRNSFSSLPLRDEHIIINTPTVAISNPTSASDCEEDWRAPLDNIPKYNMDELIAMSRKYKDPYELVEKDVCTLSGGIKELLGSDHPVLAQCAEYFFKIDSGKKIRPTMVLAVSYALNNQIPLQRMGEGLSVPLRPPRDYGASITQKRLAEITEMIHTASLFHDEVTDKASTRRVVPSVNQVFGNKLAILGGDFLLSRASVSLARLRCVEVVEIMSTAIEHLVKGEIISMKPQHSKALLESYLLKNFYKTASLMGHSCKAAALLGGETEQMQRAVYLYGTYVGQAYQLIDDGLDFEVGLKTGIATAPTIFASEEQPELLGMIDRKFSLPGDIEKATSLVLNSKGIEKTRILAQIHAESAIESISVIGASPARDALISLACKVVARTH